MELHDFSSSRLVMKSLAEFHGDRKHLEDPIFKRTHHDYPGTKGKSWKRRYALEHLLLGGDGKIEETYTFQRTDQIADDKRLLHDLGKIDEINLPKIPVYYKLMEDGGAPRIVKCKRHYV